MKFFFDLIPVLIFFAAYKFWGIYTATTAAIIAAIAQVGFTWLRHRKVEPMQLITLGLIVVLGGTTLLLHDNRFIMWKPTLVNWLFAAAFLGSRFFGERTFIERMMGAQIQLPPRIWRRLNLSWVVFFVALGAANLYVAFYFAPDLAPADREAMWVNFKLFGMMGLTFAFVVLQAIYLARHLQPEHGAEK